MFVCIYIVGYFLKIKPINYFSWKKAKQSTTHVTLILTLKRKNLRKNKRPSFHMVGGENKED